jgi:hypothetical protein
LTQKAFTKRSGDDPDGRERATHCCGVPKHTAIAHLRDVLGDTAYESLASRGERMTVADMMTYAYDQIDQARTELNAVSK